MDFEYKKLAPDGKLVIKQVREIPTPNEAQSITPYLLNQPLRYCLFEDERGRDGVFTNHRLKAQLTLETQNIRMSEQNLQANFFANATMTYIANGRIATQNGAIANWPSASYQFEKSSRIGSYDAIASWRLNTLFNPRTYRLKVHIPTISVPTAHSPWLTLREFGQYVRPEGGNPGGHI